MHGISPQDIALQLNKLVLSTVDYISSVLEQKGFDAALLELREQDGFDAGDVDLPGPLESVTDGARRLVHQTTASAEIWYGKKVELTRLRVAGSRGRHYVEELLP